MDLSIQLRALLDQLGIEFRGLRNGPGGNGGSPLRGGGGAEVTDDAKRRSRPLNDCSYWVCWHLASGTPVKNDAEYRQRERVRLLDHDASRLIPTRGHSHL